MSKGVPLPCRTPPSSFGPLLCMYRMVHQVQRGQAPDIGLSYITHTLEMLKTIDKIAVFVENIGFIGHLLKI